MRSLRILALVLMASALATGTRAQAASAEGLWLVRGEDFLVRVTSCRDGLCGVLAGLDESPRPDHLRLDAKNSDPAKRARPLCGLPVFGGFEPAPEDTAKWQGGWIYNPDDGRTYAGDIQLVDANTLRVRGSVLGGLLGRTLTLIRQAPPFDLCEAPERFAVN